MYKPCGPHAVGLVNRSPAASSVISPFVVTLTAEVPQGNPVGVVAWISSESMYLTPVEAAPPKSTVDPGAKLAPVMVTSVPDAPVFGETPVTWGRPSI